MFLPEPVRFSTTFFYQKFYIQFFIICFLGIYWICLLDPTPKYLYFCFRNTCLFPCYNKFIEIRCRIYFVLNCFGSKFVLLSHDFSNKELKCINKISIFKFSRNIYFIQFFFSERAHDFCQQQKLK